MIPKGIEEKIRQLAYEKYLYRMENQQFFTIDRLGQEKPITPEDDWTEAQNEIIRKEKKDWE